MRSSVVFVLVASAFALVTVACGSKSPCGSAGCDLSSSQTTDALTGSETSAEVTVVDAAELPGDAEQSLSDSADASVPDDSSDTAADVAVDVQPQPDGVASCTPTAFDPGAKAPWKGSGLTAVLGSPRHRIRDAVFTPENEMVLIGKFTYGIGDTDLTDETVRVFLSDADCLSYTLLGTTLTSNNDEYGTQYGFKDDGGRAFFVVPEAKKAPLGTYSVRMVVSGDLTQADGYLFVVPKGKKAVVFDIDGTLTTSDGELIKEIVVDLLGGGTQYTEKMYADANTVVNLYAQKGYLIVYLTARPDLFTDISRKWLVDEGFPRGLLHLNEAESDFFKGSDATVAYKTAYLKYLKEVIGLDIVYAYGNADTDVWSYDAAGISKSNTFIIGKNAGMESTQPVTSYTDHLPFVQSVPSVTAP